MMHNLSAADCFRALPPQEQQSELAKLSNEAQAYLLHDWEYWARPNQLPPDGDWTTWLILAGRGFGKTRCGAEWVRKQAKTYPGCRIALVGLTAADCRDVIVEGESGILAVHPEVDRPLYESSKRRVTWANGSMATLYNASEPDQLRGPQHHFALVDELAKFPAAQELWDQLAFGLRLGEHPQVMVTTTPRPIPIIKRLMALPNTVVTRGKTMDNRANLATGAVDALIERYAGTRLGRQELDGEIIDDVPGALWTRQMIDTTRVKEAPQMARVVVAVDPSGTAGEDDEGDAIGIVVAGRGIDGRCYVLADRTCKLSPEGWARMAVTAYHQFDADRLVAERNFGGAMVKAVIRQADRDVPFKEVAASRGKSVRAEPVSALYEQGRVSHVGGFPDLEDEMVLFTSGGYMGDQSPNRADALVWAITEVMLGHIATIRTGPSPRPSPSVRGGWGSR